VPIEYLAYVAIRVSDLERSLRFYRDLLGFREVSRFELEGASPSAQLMGLDELSVRARFLERDGTRIELQFLDLPAGRALPPARAQLGLSHLAVRVSDFEATLARLVAGGAVFLEASRFSHPGLGSEVAVVEDPDGVRIELIQMPGDPTRPIGELV
jgi:catechol 2,3-dioxygenase-like lactoylglutathione lyase family enzyme